MMSGPVTLRGPEMLGGPKAGHEAAGHDTLGGPKAGHEAGHWKGGPRSRIVAHWPAAAP